MPITAEELRELIFTRPAEQLVDEHVFGGDPHVFRDAPSDYQLLLTDLASSLRITAAAISVVGSAKTGFSMDPEAFGTPFHDESDVDVVVIDPDRFDRLWCTLIGWEFRLGPQQGYRKAWLKRRHDEVYWGWFFDERLDVTRLSRAAALRTLRDISYEWFEAFQSVGLRHAKLAGRKFRGRLYRTWDHARMYHVHGLLKYRDNLRREVEGVP
ncbi:MAG TPA: hypothetical protein VF219_18220 [Vicinamibacterales bacterium]